MTQLKTFHHGQFPLERIVQERRDSVTVIVPTRNCAGTIREVVSTLVELKVQGVIDEVLVIDADSPDGTAEIAESSGALVHSEHALMKEFGTSEGKGDAMWRALSVAGGELICFVDGDTQNFGPHFVTGILGPLICEHDIHYVKGYFQRPFRVGENYILHEGGRVTELTARPLLRAFWPELASFTQPLAGEMAARRDLLTRLPFSTGYAIETALLIDVYHEIGLQRLAQVDLEVRQNNHQPLQALTRMSDQVLSAVTARLVRDGRLQRGGVELVGGVTERPPLRSVSSVVSRRTVAASAVGGLTH